VKQWNYVLRLCTKFIWKIYCSHKQKCLTSYTKVMSSNVLRYPRKMPKICCILTRSLKFRQLVLKLLITKFYERPFSISWVVTYVLMKGQTRRYTIIAITFWKGTIAHAYWLSFFRKVYFDLKNNKQLFCCCLTV